MSMHKIFFGTIIFFSLAFLAACGGGSSGSAGAKGDAGAAGTIAVPNSDTNTFVTSTVDTDVDLGDVTNTYIVTGLDNTTDPDSRLRYYLYEGTSATTKAVTLLDRTGSVTCTNGGFTTSCTAGGSIIDPRGMTTDNLTLALVNQELYKTDGSITHVIICPGNEAGDAASCNAVALNDRGAVAAVPGVTTDNATLIIQLVADTTSTNDFVALKGDASGIFASDITVASVKTTAATESRDATPLVSTAVGGARTFAYSANGVATIDSESADNVTYAPISSGAIGTAVNAGATTDGHGTITDLLMAAGGSSTLLVVAQSDNVSIYSVGASSLTLWNDNLTTWRGADNSSDQGGSAFAVSPNGDRAVLVGFYDNRTSTPVVASFSPTAVDVSNTSDNASYNAANDNSDNITFRERLVGFTPNAAAAWCNDGSSGGALWVAISADNNSGFTLSKWVDNATTAATYLGTFSLAEVSTNTADNSSTDNITSLSMACDTDDNMPVLAVGYDSTNGDYALAKFDNTTSAFEKLITAAAATTAQDPVTVAASSDGSVYAIGYAAASGDNASIRLFFDE